MLAFLNVFFFVFHTLWVLFCCLGWAWRRTRPWHLLAVGLTAVSWFGFGFWRGWGYCLCTDWHWQVRERLGYPYEYSYTGLLIRQATGIDVDARTADLVTGAAFAAATLLGLALSARDVWKKRRARTAPRGF
jgi:hypothetical protein